MLAARPHFSGRMKLLAPTLLLCLMVGCTAPTQAPSPVTTIPTGVPTTAVRVPPDAGATAAATAAPQATGAATGQVEAESAAPAILPLAGAALPSSPSTPDAPAAGSGNQATAQGQASPAPSTGQDAEYVSPAPGSGYNPPGTTIAVRYGDVLPAADYSAYFHVSGGTSGPHSGKLALSDDQKTLIFKPDQPFLLGETAQVLVDAWGTLGQAASHPALNFSFSIAPVGAPQSQSTAGQLVPPNSAPDPGAQDPAGGARQYATLPADFPGITVTVPASGTGPGYIFASNFQLTPGPSGYYLLILDNNGEPVYYQKLAANTMALDFKLQSDGTLSYADRARNAFVVMDNSYREIRTITPGNGYQALDYHDLQLLPNGHYLFMANEARSADLSTVAPGGNAQASLTGQVIQEIDRSGNVVFQWRTLDYLPAGDTTEPLTAPQIDFSHDNAIALDQDGNLLLSIRHLDEVIKINRQSGAIMWRLGGKENQFTFNTAPGVNGPAEFYHQHDIRRLANGHITLFDNHNDKDPKVSRALEYSLDENAKTATLVWSWQTNPAPYAIAMGNVQRLDNGNSVVGWGTNLFPNIDEVKPDGTPAFELDFSGSNTTYRAFRFPWQGNPTWPPALVAQATGEGTRLTFSWNGATNVASYQVSGGDTPAASNPISNVSKQGFETSLVLPAGQNGFCYFRVTPLDAGGNAGPSSQAVSNPTCASGQQ